MRKRKIMTVLLCAVLLTGCGSAPLRMDRDEMRELGMLIETPEPTTEEPTTEAPTEIETLPPETDPVIPPMDEIDGEVGVVNGILVVNSGTDHARALEQYGGNKEVGAHFAEVLNVFKWKLGSEVNVYAMVVPTSAAYYTPEDWQSENGDQQAQFENIADCLEDVTPVPLYEALLYHRNEPIYSRTDYHWQPLGAYYAAAELAKAADVPFADLETYEKVDREGYLGAFYKVNKVAALEDAPEVFTYYKPADLDALECSYFDTDYTNERAGSMFHEDLPIGASYTVMIGTDECIFRAKTQTDNDRVLVIFKDSYGNALVPFLTSSFSTIYLCDFRYFNTDAQAFVESVGATDVVIAMSTMACTVAGKVDTLAGNLGA